MIPKSKIETNKLSRTIKLHYFTLNTQKQKEVTMAMSIIDPNPKGIANV